MSFSASSFYKDSIFDLLFLLLLQEDFIQKWEELSQLIEIISSFCFVYCIKFAIFVQYKKNSV